MGVVAVIEIFYEISQFKKAIQELDKVIIPPSDKEGLIELPDGQVFSSRLIDTEYFKFDKKDKDYEFRVSLKIPILKLDDELDDFYDVTGKIKQKGIVEFPLYIVFGTKYLVFWFDAWNSSLAYLCRGSISIHKYFFNLYQSSQGMFAVLDDDFSTSLIIDSKENDYLLDISNLEKISDYVNDIYNEKIDDLAQKLLDEIYITEAIKHLDFNIPERDRRQELKVLFSDEGLEVDKKTLDEIILTQFSCDGNFAAVKKMIDSGVEVNTLVNQKYLLVKDYLPDVSFKQDLTPLMGASMNGHNEVVRLLLHHKAKPNIQNAQGDTALELAAKYGF